MLVPETCRSKFRKRMMQASPNVAKLTVMNCNPHDLQVTIERHNREIAELQTELRSLKDGYARKQIEADIQSRISKLEADIKLQELQEQMAKEEAERQTKKRGLFRWR